MLAAFDGDGVAREWRKIGTAELGNSGGDDQGDAKLLGLGFQARRNVNVVAQRRHNGGFRRPHRTDNSLADMDADANPQAFGKLAFKACIQALDAPEHGLRPPQRVFRAGPGIAAETVNCHQTVAVELRVVTICFFQCT